MPVKALASTLFFCIMILGLCASASAALHSMMIIDAHDSKFACVESLFMTLNAVSQPVVKPNRKCCVNGKVESGALKNFFLGSESVLLHSTLER